MANGDARAKLDAHREEVLALVADATPMPKIAKRFEVGLRSLWRWVGYEENRADYDAACEESAEAWAAKGWQYVEEAESKSTADVSLAKLRADFCMQMAAKRNRKTFGDGPQVQVTNNLNLNDLHLSALQQLGNMAALPRRPEALTAEVVEDDG